VGRFIKQNLMWLPALLGMVFLFQDSMYKFWPELPLSPASKEILYAEGRKALENRDVPVSAILMYKDKIIGKGHNTVEKLGNIGLHAEINAISDARNQLGNSGFMALKRDSLVLMTTLEPCLMCRGAMLEYDIRNLRFLKAKGQWESLRNKKKEFFYNLYRRQADGRELQDSLLYQHPDYHP
jgi:tRNA(Arg) A34 adenosine deaminase TadA